MGHHTSVARWLVQRRGQVATVTEVAKRNNFAASIIHSLPLTSLLAFIWLYAEQKDSALIARHSLGTFWFVLPTLPMFLVLPWLISKGMTFWPALGLCIAGTVVLYFVTMKLLGLAGVQLCAVGERSVSFAHVD